MICPSPWMGEAGWGVCVDVEWGSGITPTQPSPIEGEGRGRRACLANRKGAEAEEHSLLLPLDGGGRVGVSLDVERGAGITPTQPSPIEGEGRRGGEG